ncbi:hypothetical protein ACHAPT_010756 [Fusarium lateritium]
MMNSQDAVLPTPVDQLAAQAQEWFEQDNQRNESVRTVLQRLRTAEDETRRLKRENDDLAARNREYKSRLTAQTKDPYVAVLVDGDGAKFQDSLLQEPEEGANDAALALKQHVVDYLRDTNIGSDITIFARVFANVRDLAQSLRLSGIINHDEKFWRFVTNFTNARAEFDFVDVGSGKENADSKIRRMLKYYHDDVRCKKIFFVACHDAGYAHDLRPYMDYIDDQGGRLVLVETTPAAMRIKKLGLPITRFENVFRDGLLQNETRVLPHVSPPRKLPSPPPPPPSLQPRLQPATTTTTTTTTTTATATSTTVKSGNGGISTKYKGSYAAAGGSGSHQNIDVGTTRPRALKVIELNVDGVRLDPPPRIPGNIPAQDTYKRKLAEAKGQAFCNSHYLSGSCQWGANCTREHDRKLTPDELVIHRYKARSCPCFGGPLCADFSCPMSHHCPLDPYCTRGNDCKFRSTKAYGDMHLGKEGLKAAKRWTEGADFPEQIST